MVRYYGVYECNRGKYIVTELCNGRNISLFISSGSALSLVQTNPISDERKLQMYGILSVNFIRICDMACGMRYLAEQHIVHADLALRNLLIPFDNSISIKVSDFGLSKILASNYSYKRDESSLLSVRWASPEVLEYRKFSEASDVWSFAVTAWYVKGLEFKNKGKFIQTENFHIIFVPQIVK